jgi:hypothetical protein
VLIWFFSEDGKQEEKGVEGEICEILCDFSLMGLPFFESTRLGCPCSKVMEVLNGRKKEPACYHRKLPGTSICGT